MSSVWLALLVVLISTIGLFLGSWLRCRIPEHHVGDETSIKSLELAAAVMGTLVALVIGLLVSSSKNSFDQTTTTIVQTGAAILSLDGLLAQYGPESREARSLLRKAIHTAYHQLEAGSGSIPASVTRADRPAYVEKFDGAIRALEPANEVQKSLQQDAQELSSQVLQARWLLIEQTKSELPTMFVVMLIVWLFVLFAIFGLITPRNPTTLSAQVITALSMAGAIFLILELNRPLDGTMRVSLAPLANASEILGAEPEPASPGPRPPAVQSSEGSGS